MHSRASASKNSLIDYKNTKNFPDAENNNREETHVAPDRNISTVFAFVQLERAVMSNAEAKMITTKRRMVFPSAFMMMIGTRRRTMTSQAIRARANLLRKESDKREIFGSRENFG